MPKKATITGKKKAKKENRELEINIYNLLGKIIDKQKAPKEIFGAKVSPNLIAQFVKAYLANKRAGTHLVKTRSEVVGSTRKIYRQKGTGRARHGSIKAPIFKGGGIAHGPKIKDYSQKMPKKMKRAALFGILSDKLKSGKIRIVKDIESVETKTKKISEVLENFGFKKKDKKIKVLLILTQKVNNVLLAGRNIANLSIEEAGLINTYSLLEHDQILFSEGVVEKLESHFLKRKEKNEKKSRTNAKPIRKEKLKKMNI